jgi:hypothetical protein
MKPVVASGNAKYYILFYCRFPVKRTSLSPFPPLPCLFTLTREHSPYFKVTLYTLTPSGVGGECELIAFPSNIPSSTQVSDNNGDEQV